MNKQRQKLKKIVLNGYFPEELPPIFTTYYLSQKISKLEKFLPFDSQGNLLNNGASKGWVHSIARKQSGYRRYLEVPNPYHFITLAYLICKNYKDISTIIKSSDINKTFSNLSINSNNFIQRNSLQVLVDYKIDSSLNKKYLVKTDVCEFYSSIYTHSIPWAMHGKKKAKKARKNNDSEGNKIDCVVRNSQDCQTVGIPIGPVTSLLLSEVILSRVDNILKSKIKNLQSVRYIDDYNFYCNTYEEAENIIVSFEKALKEYELKLNPLKTKIIKLPDKYNPDWYYTINKAYKGIYNSKDSLLNYFDYILHLQNKYPYDSVIKYSLSLISNNINLDNIALPIKDLLQKLVLHTIKFEPSILPIAFDIFSLISNIDKKNLELTLKNVIPGLINSNYINELCWVLYFFKMFNISMSPKELKVFFEIDDPAIILIILDLINSNNVVFRQADFKKWEFLIKDKESLFDRNWVLAYELSIKDWAYKPNINANYNKNDFFEYMISHKIPLYVSPTELTHRKLRRSTNPYLIQNDSIENSDDEF